MRACPGREFSAKDFRTFAGTVLAAEELSREARPEQKGRRERVVTGAIERAAERPGNTASVCRECYIRPAVLEAYEEGLTPSPAGGSREERRAIASLLRWRATAGRGRCRRGSRPRSRAAGSIDLTSRPTTAQR